MLVIAINMVKPSTQQSNTTATEGHPEEAGPDTTGLQKPQTSTSTISCKSTTSSLLASKSPHEAVDKIRHCCSRLKVKREERKKKKARMKQEKSNKKEGTYSVACSTTYDLSSNADNSSIGSGSSSSHSNNSSIGAVDSDNERISYENLKGPNLSTAEFKEKVRNLRALKNNTKFNLRKTINKARALKEEGRPNDARSTLNGSIKFLQRRNKQTIMDYEWEQERNSYRSN